MFYRRINYYEKCVEKRIKEKKVCAMGFFILLSTLSTFWLCFRNLYQILKIKKRKKIAIIITMWNL